MPASFSCDTGLYFFDCGGDDQGCCSVNNACLQQFGCPDAAECNSDVGETQCGALCCPDDVQCSYLGYSCEGLINGAIVTVIPSPPSSTSTITSTQTLILVIPNSQISTTTKTSASTLDSTTDLSTKGAASIVSPSAPPSSQPGLATKITSLLTSTSTSSPGNANLGSPSSSASSSSSNSHGAAIGGSIGAVVGLILAVCLICWLLVWRRRKTNDEKRRLEGSEERQMQGTGENGGGAALDTENGTNEKTANSIRTSIITMLSPNCRRRAKHSIPEPSPVYGERGEPDGNVSNPELPSDPPADQIAELPAEVERPAVHAPGRASESSWTDINSNAGTVEMAGESPMSPNLDVGEDGRGRSLNRGAHVLSFMNYDDKMPSPVR